MPLLSELKQYDRELKNEVLRLKDEVTESDWDAIILLEDDNDDDDNDQLRWSTHDDISMRELT